MIERAGFVVAQNVANRMPDNFDAKHHEQPDESKSTQERGTPARISLFCAD